MAGLGWFPASPLPNAIVPEVGEAETTLLAVSALIEALLGLRCHGGEQLDERAVRVTQEPQAVTPRQRCARRSDLSEVGHVARGGKPRHKVVETNEMANVGSDDTVRGKMHVVLQSKCSFVAAEDGRGRTLLTASCQQR